MKINKHLVKYIDKRILAVHQLLAMKPAYWKRETFHKIRVEIKKINAVFGIVNYCVENFPRKKVFYPFKVIFKRAGSVRDLQIQEIFLKKNKIILSGYHVPGKHGNAIQEKKKKFFRTLDKKFFIEIHKSRKQIEKGVSEMKRKDADEYFKNEFMEIKILLEQKLSTKQFHRLRRQLKKNYFNLKALNFRRRIPFTELSKYLDLLGRLNDRRVTLFQLRNTIDARKLNPTKRKLLAKLKSKLTSQSARLREMIISRNKKIIPLMERLILEF